VDRNGGALISGSNPVRVYIWGGCGIPEKPIRVADVSAKIRNEHLPNACHKLYRLSQLVIIVRVLYLLQIQFYYYDPHYAAYRTIQSEKVFVLVLR
jgi:hypothetical protein